MFFRLMLLFVFMVFGIVLYVQDIIVVFVSVLVVVIKDLCNGILIICLLFNQCKMIVLQDVLENDDNMNWWAKWLEKELVAIWEEIWIFNNNMYWVFWELYDFLDIWFIYDYFMFEFKVGNFQGYLLNVDLELDVSIMLE